MYPLEKLETWIKYESELIERLLVRKRTPSPGSLADFPSAELSLAFRSFASRETAKAGFSKIPKLKTHSGMGLGLHRKKNR